MIDTLLLGYRDLSYFILSFEMEGRDGKTVYKSDKN